MWAPSTGDQYVFCVQESEFEAYLNTLQRAAEVQGLLDLGDAALDEWVPERVVRTYVTRVLQSMRALVADVGVQHLLG